MVKLPPAVTLASAPGLTQGLKQTLLSEPMGTVVVDASSLTEFDSSALAVLLECRRQALAIGKGFAVHGLPVRLRQLATLYGIAGLLPASTETSAAATA